MILPSSDFLSRAVHNSCSLSNYLFPIPLSSLPITHWTFYCSGSFCWNPPKLMPLLMMQNDLTIKRKLFDTSTSFYLPVFSIIYFMSFVLFPLCLEPFLPPHVELPAIDQHHHMVAACCSCQTHLSIDLIQCCCYCCCCSGNIYPLKKSNSSDNFNGQQPANAINVVHSQWTRRRVQLNVARRIACAGLQADTWLPDEGRHMRGGWWVGCGEEGVD